MPNWCDNTLIVSHEDAKMIDKLEQGWKTGKFFQTIFPEPDYTITPVKKTFPEYALSHAKTDEEKAKILEPTISESNWWDWRVQNWGTKWEIETTWTNENGEVMPYTINRNSNSISVSFASAWSPPIGIYDKLVDDGYSVSAMYYEGGMGFYGAYEDGIDEGYNIEGNAIWVKENIPSKIDNEFGISDGMIEYEIQDLETEIEEITRELKTAIGDKKAKFEQDLITLNNQLNELKEYA